MQAIAESPNLELCLTQGSNHDAMAPVTRVEVNEGKRMLGARLRPLLRIRQS